MADYDREIKPSEAEIQQKKEQNRQSLIDAIKTGQDLQIGRRKANGDGFLEFAAATQFLELFSQKYNLQDFPHKLTTGIGPLPETARSFRLDHLSIPDASKDDHEYLFSKSLRGLANTVGMELTPEDSDIVPKLQQMDYGPLQKYTPEQALKAGNAFLKEHGLQPNEAVVIAQSGSEGTKRFTDRQIKLIVEQVKMQQPDRKVVVVSDKKFLRKQVEDFNPGPLTGGTISFSINSEEFRQELSENLDIEGAITHEVEDINTLCGIFGQVASGVISTDSYWNHLASAAISSRSKDIRKLNKGDLITLFTNYVPEDWQPPGSTVIESPYVDTIRTSGYEYQIMMPGDNYIVSHKLGGDLAALDEKAYNFSIADEDVQLLLEALPQWLESQSTIPAYIDYQPTLESDPEVSKKPQSRFSRLIRGLRKRL